MTAILYPIAPTAEAALRAPLGHAAREREAVAAHGRVRFATEMVGPAYPTREAALDAYAGRVEDERPGRPQPAAEALWCRLAPVAAPEGRPIGRAPVQPIYRGGHRWPQNPAAAPSAWRLSVSYWKIETGTEAAPEASARSLRRTDEGRSLDAQTLAALARQPLQSVKPQQPLDIGLFECRLPEAPDTIVPDE